MTMARAVPPDSGPDPGLGSDGGDELAHLLAAAAGQDERALDRLYNATSRRVYGLALTIVRDAQLAEEATLDVYTQVWRRAAAYDPARGGALPYLLTLARTRALDLLRARTRRAGKEHELPPEFPLEDPAPDPFETRRGKERADLLRRALAALPGVQRRAIEAAYFDGLTHTEAAAALGAPLGTVKTRIRDGLAALRRSLASREEDHA